MIVQRYTMVIKMGCMQEAVKTLQDMWDWMGVADTHRIYQTFSGQINELIQEWEFEDFEAHKKFYADMFSRPEAAPWLEKMYSLEISASKEYLILVE